MVSGSDGGTAETFSPKPSAIALPNASIACFASSPSATKRKRWPCVTPSATIFIKLFALTTSLSRVRFCTVIFEVNFFTSLTKFALGRACKPCSLRIVKVPTTAPSTDWVSTSLDEPKSAVKISVELPLSKVVWTSSSNKRAKVGLIWSLTAATVITPFTALPLWLKIVLTRLNAKAFFTFPTTESVTHNPLPSGNAELLITSEIKRFSTALCICNCPALIATKVNKLWVSTSKVILAAGISNGSIISPIKIARNSATSVIFANFSAVSSSLKTRVSWRNKDKCSSDRAAIPITT